MTGCSTPLPYTFSLQTTLLHEMGRALGLGTSKDASSVMYGAYQGPRCSLAPVDVQGVSALYAQP